MTTNSQKTVTGRQLCDNSTTILDRTKYLIFYGLTSYLTKQRESWNCRLRKVKLKSRLGCLQYFTHYSAMHKKRYKPKIMFEGFKINFFRIFLWAFERASKNEDIATKPKFV